MSTLLRVPGTTGDNSDGGTEGVLVASEWHKAEFLGLGSGLSRKLSEAETLIVDPDKQQRWMICEESYREAVNAFAYQIRTMVGNALAAFDVSLVDVLRSERSRFPEEIEGENSINRFCSEIEAADSEVNNPENADHADKPLYDEALKLLRVVEEKFERLIEHGGKVGCCTGCDCFGSSDSENRELWVKFEEFSDIFKESKSVFIKAIAYQMLKVVSKIFRMKGRNHDYDFIKVAENIIKYFELPSPDLALIILKIKFAVQQQQDALMRN